MMCVIDAASDSGELGGGAGGGRLPRRGAGGEQRHQHGHSTHCQHLSSSAHVAVRHVAQCLCCVAHAVALRVTASGFRV
jgi:hypothetical protein